MRTLALLALAAGCTTLGPMPTTTGISAVPAGRPGGEAMAGVMPTFRLSDSASGADPGGKANPMLAGLFDPDRLLGIPGLFVAARLWGEHGDTGLEPTLGYRRRLDDRMSIAGAAFGTKMKDDENGASYKATRLGGEAMLDAKIVKASITELHVQGAVAATYIKSSGTYCVETSTGLARDCDENTPIPMVDGNVSGVFPSATLTLSVDIGHKTTGSFHVARLAGMLSAGWMPRAINGDQTSGDPFLSGGVSLTIGFGAAE